MTAGLRSEASSWPCANVSFYGRRCILTAHGWKQSCQFEHDAEEDYDLTEGSTLKDFLEALSAGGMVAVSAAMRWLEYRMHRRAVEAEELFGAGHMLTQDRRSGLEVARGEQEIVMRYLANAPAPVASPDAPTDQGVIQ